MCEVECICHGFARIMHVLFEDVFGMKRVQPKRAMEHDLWAECSGFINLDIMNDWVHIDDMNGLLIFDDC